VISHTWLPHDRRLPHIYRINNTQSTSPLTTILDSELFKLFYKKETQVISHGTI